MLRRRRRLIARIALAIALLLVALVAVGAWWLLTPLPPDERALSALASDDIVAVDESPELIEFSPVGEHSRVGIVFYPGARVDPRAYAPLARTIAERGYLVVVVHMPYNLAVLGSDRATGVMNAHPEIASWVIGGHSLGGAMAARFAGQHPVQISGLALLAAYPPGSTDLSDGDMPVVSVYGTFDGILNADAFTDAMSRLPKDTTYVSVEGGNHAGFGDYGHQPGDNDATVSTEEQQEATLRAVGLIVLPLRIRTGGTQP
ncbi:MAG: alpha/beta hydrolase [Actinomycetota bacterium]|nr:alpha/beta hydrolase [Actinomycetota bacterium]